MRPTILFKFAIVAFAAAPVAFAHSSMGEDDLYSRALAHDAGHPIAARELGEAIYEVIQQRGFEGEDTAAMEARFLGFSESFVPSTFLDTY